MSTAIKVRCNSANHYDQGDKEARAVSLVGNDKEGKPYQEGVQNFSMSFILVGDAARDISYGDELQVTLAPSTISAAPKPVN